MRALLLLCSLGLGVAFVAEDAVAAKPNKAQTKRKGKAKKAAPDETQVEPEAKAQAGEEAAAEPQSDEPERAVQQDKKPNDSTPRAVETQEKEGIKGYRFGAVEVEGRLKSPQVLYFLRRVRAEFAAGDLGHRSFMRELSHTRTSSAFR